MVLGILGLDDDVLIFGKGACPPRRVMPFEQSGMSSKVIHLNNRYYIYFQFQYAISKRETFRVI